MRFVLLTAFSIFVLSLSVPGSATAGENCTCRYDGKDIVEGQSICMRTPNGMQMAKCDRVLNNTSWKFTGAPCPYAQFISAPPSDAKPLLADKSG